MLVLSRRVDSWIEIQVPNGPVIKVKLLGIKSKRMAVLGVAAPDEYLITRGPEHPGTSDLPNKGH
jgi:sRNA-binding carbon storage regulator CsrA